MSSMRIVLVDPLGDILFSGESIIAGESILAGNAEPLPETLPTPIAAAVAAIAASPDSETPTEPEPRAPLSDDDADDGDDADLCPETMRSAGSGVFRAVDRRSTWRKVG